MANPDFLLQQLLPAVGEGTLFSRRDLGRLLGFSALVWGTGCRSTKPPVDSEIHRELEDLAETVISLKSSDPSLPGLAAADQIAAVAFSSDRSAEDARILAGRLYLDAFDRLRSQREGRASVSSAQSVPSQLSRDRVREVLSGPIPEERFTRVYFDNLLAETRTRMDSDRSYRDRIADFAERAQRRRSCTCNLGVPCWACIVIVIVIIIIVIIVL